jgi:trehalose 6-phosphate phosphatase
VKYVFSPQGRRVLTQFALSNVLLAFDYDGTLSPIVTDRNRAPMRRRTLRLLSTVCQKYPCAVISGRARADVSTYLDGIQTRYVIGNHGLEPTRQMKQFSVLVAEVHHQLGPLLGHLPGVDIEDKRYSLAVHYRRSRQSTFAREQIIRAIGALSMPVRLMHGKRVINVLPDGAPHKGIAVQQLRSKAQADTAIYIGDDVTDEDVFDLDQPGRLLSIRVGRSIKSSASYYLRTQLEIDPLLHHLIRVRNVDASND